MSELLYENETYAIRGAGFRRSIVSSTADVWSRFVRIDSITI